MISITFFTFIFIIIVSLACAQPWKIPSNTHRATRDLSTVDSDNAEAECLVTYQAFQPNIDFFTEKVAEITVNRCNNNNKSSTKIKRKRKPRKNNKVVKKKRKTKKRRKSNVGLKNRRKPKTKSGRKSKKKNRKSSKKKRKRKNKKIFRELKVFRRWKTMMSQQKLMSQPVAQKAVSDLWTDLFKEGEEWKEIFEDMHQLGDDHSLTETTTENNLENNRT